jgi:hypothetical protein
MTPELGALKTAYNPATKSVVYATDKEIREKGFNSCFTYQKL